MAETLPARPDVDPAFVERLLTILHLEDALTRDVPCMFGRQGDSIVMPECPTPAEWIAQQPCGTPLLTCDAHRQHQNVVFAFLILNQSTVGCVEGHLYTPTRPLAWIRI
jgi:hypothetical protein